jgi:hypothetical protein
MILTNIKRWGVEMMAIESGMTIFHFLLMIMGVVQLDSPEEFYTYQIVTSDGIAIVEVQEVGGIYELTSFVIDDPESVFTMIIRENSNLDYRLDFEEEDVQIEFDSSAYEFIFPFDLQENEYRVIEDELFGTVEFYNNGDSTTIFYEYEEVNFVVSNRYLD